MASQVVSISEKYAEALAIIEIQSARIADLESQLLAISTVAKVTKTSKNSHLPPSVEPRFLPKLWSILVHSDNNGSERAIRIVKIKTKISGQFKSLHHEFAADNMAGIIVIRPHRNIKLADMCHFTLQIVQIIEERDPTNCLWILDSNKLRIRYPK
jgi:hypothetical protein